MFREKVVFFLTATLFLTSTSKGPEVMAQEINQETEFILPEITVDAVQDRSRINTLDPSSVVPKTTITEKEIQELDAKTAADAVILSPGVTPVGPGDNGDRFENVQIRGFDPNYTLTLINGQRVTSQSVDGKFDLSTINADEIEKIEIIRGPQALLYGSDAIGGVVNIVMKIPKDRLGAGVSAGYGQLNTFRSRTFVEGPLSKKFRARLDGRYDFSDGFTDSFDLDRDLRQQTLKADAKPQRTGEARADFHLDIGEKATGRFSARYLNRNLSIEKRFSKFVEEGVEGGSDRKQDISGTAVLERHGLWGGRGELSLNSYTSFFDKKRGKDFVRRDAGRFIFREESSQREDVFDTLLSGRLLYERPLGKHNRLTAWTETRWQKRSSEVRGQTQRFDEEDRVIADNTSDKAEKIYSKQEIFLVGGVQDEISFKRHGATAGVRVEKARSWPLAVTPAAGLRFGVTPDMDIRANAGFGYKFPTLEELTRSPVPELDIDGTRFVAGNPDLKPERSRQYEIVFDQRLSDVVGYSVTGFFNQFYDKIETGIVDDFLGTDLPLETKVNIGRAYTAGSEIDIKFSPLKNFGGRVNYSYLWTRNLDTGAPLNEAPTHRVNLLLNTRIPKVDVHVDLSFSYISSRKRIDALSGVEKADSPMAPLYLARLHLSKEWGKGFSTDLSVENLFNVKWDRDNDGDTDMPGIGVFTTVSWKNPLRKKIEAESRPAESEIH
ncbi:TonB-dependent receptor [Deltaproteobacteria bacterium PRO3]|nr:TonB-dependent receptor [Deltaproteobacteria bacterium PRO3]